MAKIVITKRTLTPENSKKLTKSRIKFSIILRSIAAACVMASVYDIVRVSYRELRPYTTKFIEKFLRENDTHFTKIKQLAENLTKNHHFDTFVSTTGGGFQDELFRFVNFLVSVERYPNSLESVKFQPGFSVKLLQLFVF